MIETAPQSSAQAKLPLTSIRIHTDAHQATGKTTRSGPFHTGMVVVVGLLWTRRPVKRSVSVGLQPSSRLVGSRFRTPSASQSKAPGADCQVAKFPPEHIRVCF